MQASVEISRIHGVMEKMNAKNPLRNGETIAHHPRVQEVLPVISGVVPSTSDEILSLRSQQPQLTVSTVTTPIHTPPSPVTPHGLPDQRQPPQSSVPTPSPFTASLSILRLDYIQSILNHLQYNFLPTTFFCLIKNRPFHRIVGTAKEILQESLPIRCLEATFLGLWLTCALRDVERFPIAFKSKTVDDTGAAHYYRHIVLGVRHKGLFGAIGLSRSEFLMNKPVIFSSIRELLEEFFQCYRRVGHQLVSIKLGLFASHDPNSKVVPCWRFLSLSWSGSTTSLLHTTDPVMVRTGTILENYELLLPVISDQYVKQSEKGCCGIDGMLLASPAHAASTPSGASGGGGRHSFPTGLGPLIHTTTQPQAAVGNDEDDDDVSDTDENQRRIACIVTMVSPLGPSSQATADGSAKADSKFITRLRRTVNADGVAGTPVAAQGRTPVSRTRSVPARQTPVPVSINSSAAAVAPLDSAPPSLSATQDELATSDLDQLLLEFSSAAQPMSHHCHAAPALPKLLDESGSLHAQSITALRSPPPFLTPSDRDELPISLSRLATSLLPTPEPPQLSNHAVEQHPVSTSTNQTDPSSDAAMKELEAILSAASAPNTASEKPSDSKKRRISCGAPTGRRDSNARAGARQERSGSLISVKRNTQAPLVADIL